MDADKCAGKVEIYIQNGDTRYRIDVCHEDEDDGAVAGKREKNRNDFIVEREKDTRRTGQESG